MIFDKKGGKKGKKEQAANNETEKGVKLMNKQWLNIWARLGLLACVMMFLACSMASKLGSACKTDRDCPDPFVCINLLCVDVNSDGGGEKNSLPDSAPPAKECQTGVMACKDSRTVAVCGAEKWRLSECSPTEQCYSRGIQAGCYCTPGSTRCLSAYVLQECRWESGDNFPRWYEENCSLGQTCLSVNGRKFVCQRAYDECAQPGSIRGLCEGNTLKVWTCGSSLKWMVAEKNCADGGLACSSARLRCVNECDGPDSLLFEGRSAHPLERCQGGGVLRCDFQKGVLECTRRGSLGNGDVCAEGAYCLSGSCKQGQCAPCLLDSDCSATERCIKGQGLCSAT